MKKILAFCLIVVLSLSVLGMSCSQNLQEIICNPPQAVIDVANAAAPLVAIAITLAVPGSAAYVNAVTVQGAITAIQGGACVGVTQLNALIAWIQSERGKELQATEMLKAGPMKAKAVIDAQPLIDWRDSKAGK